MARDAAQVSVVLAWLAPGKAGQIVHMVAPRVLLVRGARSSRLAVGGAASIGVAIVGLAGQAAAGLDGAAAGYSLAWLIAAVISVAAVLHRSAQDRPDAILLGMSRRSRRLTSRPSAGTGGSRWYAVGSRPALDQ